MKKARKKRKQEKLLYGTMSFSSLPLLQMQRMVISQVTTNAQGKFFLFGVKVLQG